VRLRICPQRHGQPVRHDRTIGRLRTVQVTAAAPRLGAPRQRVAGERYGRRRQGDAGHGLNRAGIVGGKSL
jgi:hypothetical protein